MRWPAVAAFAVAAFARPSEACIVVAGVPRVLPGPLASAALNTHVFVTLERDWATADACDAPPCPGDFFLTLRTAATAVAPPVDVPFDTLRTVAADEVSTLELAPKSLSPKTRYEVVLNERKLRRPPRVIGTFATSAERDVDAPAWKGMTIDAVRVLTPGEILPCGPQTSVQLKVDASPDASLYEVWTSGGAPIDTSKPARALLGAEGKLLTIAGAMLPIGKGVHIAVRPIDLSGNAGTLSEVIVDTAPKAAKK